MKKEKAGWKTTAMYVLGVIFAALFVYGLVYDIMQVTSSVAQYSAMGQNIPTSYTINAILSGALQIAVPSLFFSVASFALGSLLKSKGVKDDDAVEKIEVKETVEVSDDKADADDAKEVKADEAAESETADAQEETEAEQSEEKTEDQTEEKEEKAE